MSLFSTRLEARDLIKILLLFTFIFFIFLVIDTFPFVHFITYTFRIKGLFKFFASIFLFTGLTFSATVLILARNLWVRIFGFIFLFFALSIQYGYKTVNGYGFTFAEANTLLGEMNFVSDALNTFLPVLYKGTLVILLFCLVLFFVVTKFFPKTSLKVILPSALFFNALAYYVLWGTSGEQIYPTMFKVPLLLRYASNYEIYGGSRDKLELDIEKESEFKHIIYLIDESVRADYISLNHTENTNTPYLVSISDKIINYGVVSSGTNSSSTANFILRTGSESSAFPDKAQLTLRKSNIFQYAKNAGFTTIYMNGQKGVLSNMMRPVDLETIDILFNIPEDSVPRYEIDFVLAKKLLEIIGTTENPTFSYVYKIGAHFHYETCYPQDEKIYKPTMEIGSLNNDSIKMRNSYRNAIRWNVDEFFKYLVPKLTDSTLIIYTSDHGQNLLEHGIKSTHSDYKNPSPYQAMVPLFFYFSDSLQHSKFDYLQNNYNKASHFNIFPTIIEILGYSEVVLEDFNDDSLFDPLNQERNFYSGSLFLTGNLYENLFDDEEMKYFIKSLTPYQEPIPDP